MHAIKRLVITPIKKHRYFKNYIFSALAGTTWFLQFFFYGMGESKMGNGASSWILHMAFIILVANIWGIVLKNGKVLLKKPLLQLLSGILNYNSICTYCGLW